MTAATTTADGAPRHKMTGSPQPTAKPAVDKRPDDAAINAENNNINNNNNNVTVQQKPIVAKETAAPKQQQPPVAAASNQNGAIPSQTSANAPATPRAPSPQKPQAGSTAAPSSNKSTLSNNNNNYGGLNLNMSASEMREHLARRKKFDPKKTGMNIMQKYEIIQQM